MLQRANMVSLFILCGLIVGCKGPCDIRPGYYASEEDIEYINTSLSSSEPCSPPCWHNIIPGATQEQDAIQIVNDLYFVDADSFTSLDNVTPAGEGTSLSWRSAIMESYDSPIINIQVAADGVVEFILEALLYPVTLQELIDLYGEPDAIYSYPYSGVPPGQRPVCQSATIIWFDEGLSVTLNSVAKNKLDAGEVSLVEPDCLATLAVYDVPVNDLQEYISLQNISNIEEYLTPWSEVDYP